MKYGLIILILQCYFCGNAQTFSKQYDYEGTSQFKNIVCTDYGYLIQGEKGDTTDAGVFFRSMLVGGFDFNGDTIFYKKYNSSSWNIASLYDVNTTIGDSLFIVANERSFIDNDTLYASLWWYNDQGDTVGTKQYASPYYNASNDPLNSSWWMRPTSLTRSDNGEFIYLVCQVIDYPPIQNSFILMKLTNTGEIVWTYHQPFDDHYYACNVVVFHDGNPWALIAGVGGVDYPHRLLEINDELGSEIQTISLAEGMESINRGSDDIIMLNDGAIIASKLFGVGSNLTPSIYKMSYEGELMWQNLIPNGENIEQYNDHLVQAQDGGFVCAAVHYQGGATPGLPGVNNYVYRTWLWKVDANGNFLWDRKYEYLSLDSAYFNVYAYPHDLKATPDGGFIVAGEATATCSNYPACDAFIQQGWLLKVDGCGCLVPGCDESCFITSPELNAEEKTSYFLYGPNPIEDALHIYLRSSSLLDLSNTTLSFYDQLGRRVHSLSLVHDDTTYIIDTNTLSIGEYILVLEKDGQILQSEKLVKR